MKKLIISTKDLKPVLARLSPAINTKPVLPVLANIHFTVTPSQAVVRATDMAITIIDKVECNTDDSFEFMLPFEFISKVVALNPMAPLTVKASAKEVVIETGIDTYRIKVPKDEFPPVPEVKDQNRVELSRQTIGSLNRALITVAKNHQRAQFNYVLCDVTETAITVVSTEGGNILFTERTLATSTKAEELLIDPIVVKAIANCQQAVLTWNDKLMSFQDDNYRVICTRCEYKFVNYRSILNENPVNVIVEKVQMEEALGKCMLVKDMLHTVDLSIAGIAIMMEASDEEITVKTNVDLKKETEAIELSVNALKLSLLLKQIQTEEIGFAIVGPKSPVMLHAIGDDTIKSMLMPIAKGGAK